MKKLKKYSLFCLFLIICISTKTIASPCDGFSDCCQGNCPSGQRCYNGECVAYTISCIDSDGGLNYNTYGWTTQTFSDGSIETHYDHCWGAGNYVTGPNVYEYACNGVEDVFENHPCDSGLCEDGICVESYPTTCQQECLSRGYDTGGCNFNPGEAYTCITIPSGTRLCPGSMECKCCNEQEIKTSTITAHKAHQSEEANSYSFTSLLYFILQILGIRI